MKHQPSHGDNSETSEEMLPKINFKKSVQDSSKTYYDNHMMNYIVNHEPDIYDVDSFYEPSGKDIKNLRDDHHGHLHHGVNIIGNKNKRSAAIVQDFSGTTPFKVLKTPSVGRRNFIPI